MKPQRLSIESEALEEFRQRLSAALEIVTCQMVRMDMMEGVVSAKIKIRLEAKIDEKTGELYHLMELEPSVGMKIGASDKMEVGKTGCIMKVDAEGRPVIASNQIGMDEIMQEGA